MMARPNFVPRLEVRNVEAGGQVLPQIFTEIAMRRASFCDGLSRRNLLRIGVAAPFGLGVTLSSLLAGETGPAGEAACSDLTD